MEKIQKEYISTQKTAYDVYVRLKLNFEVKTTKTNLNTQIVINVIKISELKYSIDYRYTSIDNALYNNMIFIFISYHCPIIQ